ncbi:MAG TPA: hypothetical protein VI911_00735 [Patescibacteria group bacterium]|nr:hypothetical protein [Patescibacteria group bacterium]
MYAYKLVLLNGLEVDLLGTTCTYLSISRDSGRSRNQNCDPLEVIADHNNDNTFIEVGKMLIPVRSILFVESYTVEY